MSVARLYGWNQNLRKGKGGWVKLPIDPETGALVVTTEQQEDTVSEIDHTGDTVATEFGIVSLANDNYMVVHNIIVSITTVAIGGTLLEYWNGTSWSVLARVKVAANGGVTIPIDITGKFKTGIRAIGQKFFRITNVVNSTKTAVSIISHQCNT